MTHNLINTICFTLLCLGFLVAGKSYAYDAVYIFGDSLSDTGNAKAFSGSEAIPERFTNGPVAADYVTAAYGIEAIPSLFLSGVERGNNYAVGGARATDSDGDETTPDTHLPTQINSYLTYNGYAANPEALYMVIVGGNDLFAAQQMLFNAAKVESRRERKALRHSAKHAVKEAVASIEAQVMKLIQAGAKNILIGNAPDIGSVPLTDNLVDTLLSSATSKAQKRRAYRLYHGSSKLSFKFNKRLSRVIKRIERKTGVDIIDWDMASFIDKQIAAADMLGYTNTEDACDTLPLCEGFIFVDGVHPTTIVHQRAAEEMLYRLEMAMP